jgi:hypothetical protein
VNRLLEAMEAQGFLCSAAQAVESSASLRAGYFSSRPRMPLAAVRRVEGRPEERPYLARLVHAARGGRPSPCQALPANEPAQPEFAMHGLFARSPRLHPETSAEHAQWSSTP